MRTWTERRLERLEARTAVSSDESDWPTIQDVLEVMESCDDAPEYLDLARDRACGQLTPEGEERVKEIYKKAMVDAFGPGVAGRILAGS